MTTRQVTIDGAPRRRGDTVTIGNDRAVVVAVYRQLRPPGALPLTVLATEIPCRSADCAGTLEHVGESWACPECSRGYRHAELADLLIDGWPEHSAWRLTDDAAHHHAEAGDPKATG